MHRYRTYMDQISLSPQQHQRLLAALKARPSQKRRPQAYRALAACACLALALLAGRYVLSSPLSQPTQSPTHTPAAFGQPYQLLTFTDRTGEPQSSLDLAFPLGSFQEELSRQEWLDVLGCAPFWEEAWPDSTLTACAIYDGEGQIWEVRLSGDTPAGESFYLRLAPGALPPECVLYEGGVDNLVEGVTVHADYRHWDRDGDGNEEYVYTASFLTESVGVRLEVQTGDSSGAQLASAGVSAMLTGSGLTLDHLRPEEIPEWRSEELTLSQARGEEGLGQYLPQALPEGFSFQEAHRELGQGRDWLSALWCRGYDDIHIWVSRPEASPQVMEVSNTAYYDVNLYSIPWADSVPHEVLFGGFQDPVFRFEDLTQEVISARARYVEGDQGDTPGWRFSQFSVLHPDGVLVRYNLRGLTPQQATQLILGN